MLCAGLLSSSGSVAPSSQTFPGAPALMSAWLTELLKSVEMRLALAGWRHCLIAVGLKYWSVISARVSPVMLSWSRDHVAVSVRSRAAAVGPTGIAQGCHPAGRWSWVLLSLPAPGKQSDLYQRDTARAAAYCKRKSFFPLFSFFYLSWFLGGIEYLCASQEDMGRSTTGSLAQGLCCSEEAAVIWNGNEGFKSGH